MTKRKVSKLLSLLACLSSLTLNVSCGKENSSFPAPSPSETPSEKISQEEKESTSEEDDSFLSDEKADKSKLTYVASLDKYKKTDWSGHWIWSDSAVANSYVAFRKSFELKDVPENAIASIAAENKYYVWVNSTLVIYDGGYKRGPTLEDTYYQDFNFAPYLKQGSNNITVLVSYFGRSGTSSLTAQEAGFLFERTAGKKTIKSDSSWKVKRLKEYKNKNLLKGDYPNYPQFAALAEWNCYYDARDSVGKYYKEDFDDSSWSNATLVGKVGCLPFNDTYLCLAPAFSFDKGYTEAEDAGKYLNLTFTEGKTIKIDLGKDQQFSPYFELNSEEDGKKIVYYTDTYRTENSGSFKDVYITKKGEQSYESYPWRSGRYLFREVPAGVTLKKVGYRRNGYDTKVIGSFSSSDEQLDKLYKMACDTLTICRRDTYRDCPERERAPWAGDVANQIAQSLYALDGNANLLTKKTILSLLGYVSADEDSEIPNCIPLRMPCNKLTENSTQCLAFLNSIYEYYLYTGDKETCELVYPILLNYLKVYERKDGLVKYRTGTFQWTDWGDGTIDSEVIENCQYYLALKDVLSRANDFQKEEDKSFLQDRITSIEDNFRKKYLKEKGFSSSATYDDRANAWAVVSGLAKEEDYPLVKDVLTNVRNCSVYRERYVQEALGIRGEFSLATERTKSRYKSRIESDYGTLWENFEIGENYETGTPNHAWAGGPLIRLDKYYLGIKPTKPGYESYEINLSSSLEKRNGKVSTVKGNISVDVDKEKQFIKIETIDANGTLHLPKSYSANPKLVSCQLIESTDTEFVIKLSKGVNQINL